MPLAQAKITSQGQISVPKKVRERLGVGPGSTVVFEEKDGQVVVRRAGTYTFEDIHKRLFPNGPPKRVSVAEMDAGIAAYMIKKHGRPKAKK